MYAASWLGVCTSGELSQRATHASVRRMRAGADFQSKNCLREIAACTSFNKPMCLMFDPVRGGATLHEIEAECSDELRRTIFGGREVIIWHRIKGATCSPIHPIPG